MDRAQKHIYIAVNEYLAQNVYRDKAKWNVLQDKLKEGGVGYFTSPLSNHPKKAISVLLI